MEEKDKISLADTIIEHCFQRNFGSMSKVDLDTLLFSEYLKSRRHEGKSCDDYTLSKELGISQSRVRVLKERKGLKYPDENFSWERDIADALKNVQYDAKTERVSFLVEDVNVLIELNHFIEMRGWYNECTLNRKVMVLRPRCYFELCCKNKTLEELLDDEAKKKLQKISSNDSMVAKLLTEGMKAAFPAFVGAASSEVISKVIGSLSVNASVKTGLEKLTRIFKNVYSSSN